LPCLYQCYLLIFTFILKQFKTFRIFLWLDRWFFVVYGGFLYIEKTLKQISEYLLY